MKDIYLKFGNPAIKGESADKDHAGWIEIDSWSHSITQPRSATASTAGGHTSERCEHADMQFTKDIDVVSPLIYQHASGGTTFDEVTIDFMRSDGEGNRIKYLEVKLKYVIISSVTPSVVGEGLPSEQFSLKYAAVQWKYTQQKIGGNQGGNAQGAWSLTKNDKTCACHEPLLRTPMKRFEPSFLDKLFDDEPHLPASPAMRQLSLEELKATVARDVEAILNTRIALTEHELAALPECQRSVLTYGLNDFAGLSLASHYDRTFICKSIQQAIARHEPRLQQVSVTLELNEQSTNALYFAIQALLVVHPAEEPVSFDAMLQPSTLQYSVTRARAKL